MGHRGAGPYEVAGGDPQNFETAGAHDDVFTPAPEACPRPQRRAPPGDQLDQIAVDIATAGGIEVLIDACARHPDSPIVAARVAGAR